MAKYFVLVVMTYLVSACGMSQHELAQRLYGSWTGSSKVGEWCITYFDDKDKRVEFYIINYGSERHEKVKTFKHRLGYWETAKGMRFRQETDSTHDANGNEIPLERRSGAFEQYFMREYLGDSFTYVNAQSEDLVYTNLRTQNCSSFEERFLSYVAELQAALQE